jgi:hypothetical protein
MRIPKAPQDVIIYWVIAVVVCPFTCLAVVDIVCRVALIASLLWLVFIISMFRSAAKAAGGWNKLLIDIGGILLGRDFVEAGSPDLSMSGIRFGYELFGRRFIQQSIAVDKIESISWSTGQATQLAGRDANDWQVCLWYDHGDPVKSEKKKKWRKPDQDIRVIGPARRKKVTEKFGLALIDFFRDSGARLVQGESTASFVRSMPWPG